MGVRRAKYGNRKVAGYDSKREARRAAELRLLERAGKIAALREQVHFELIPAQYIDGKCVERAVKYIADFVYVDLRPRGSLPAGAGFTVVEDAKGVRTRDYVIKRKLLLWRLGLRVLEV